MIAHLVESTIVLAIAIAAAHLPRLAARTRYAIVFLALRLNGQEPPEEWEEPNVWGQWRTETW